MQEKILDYLRNTSDYTSGQDLSDKLNITRSAIWKNIKKLRSLGYEIDAVSNVGYKLVKSSDKLLPLEFGNNIKTKMMGKSFYYFDSIESTMDEALKLAVNNAEEGTVVCAETQTKGRGRMQRKWESPSGKGIYCSIILRPKLQVFQSYQIVYLSGVALAESICKFTGLNATIKWPNDILIDNKKVSGILTELNAETDSINFVIVGFGINVNSSRKEIPTTGTSLKLEMKSLQDLNRVALLKEILTNFENNYFDMEKIGFEIILKKWKDLSSTMGSQIVISDQSGETKGVAVDINEFGGLLIKTKQGQIIKKMSGDVTYIK